jgi:hypothetical protein
MLTYLLKPLSFWKKIKITPHARRGAQRTMEISYTLSRWRERGGVRVDMISGVFPLTAALRHPVFPDFGRGAGLYPLPMWGEESATGYFYKSLPLTVRVLDNNR